MRNPTLVDSQWYAEVFADDTILAQNYNISLYSHYQVTIECDDQGQEQFLYAALGSGSKDWYKTIPW